MLKRFRNRKGFSLIELLIVIAIIGIIATIAIPILLSARQGAIREKARNSLRSIVSAEAAFYATNGEYGDLTDLNVPPADPPGQSPYIDDTIAGGVIGQGITIAVTGHDNTTFTATATYPDPAGAAGDLLTFTATQTGDITGPV